MNQTRITVPIAAGGCAAAFFAKFAVERSVHGFAICGILASTFESTQVRLQARLPTSRIRRPNRMSERIE
jgi:hypothetical protein